MNNKTKCLMGTDKRRIVMACHVEQHNTKVGFRKECVETSDKESAGEENGEIQGGDH